MTPANNVQTTSHASSRPTGWGATLSCVGFFLLCVVLIRPLLESGLTDDWSTVRTAQLLAETGHIHYNGWEAALLGWPLYVAALFAKLFGPSFANIRLSNLFEAVLTVVLLHRVFLRAGLNLWNATIGTLALGLTPIFLLASVLFMTDIPGLLALLVCFYTCLRALEAAEEQAAAQWICVAALGNAVLGTTRQIAWLGVLVMLPCALWRLRHRRRVLLVGAAATALGWIFILLCMRWFAHQPYTLTAPLLPTGTDFSLRRAAQVSVRIALDLALFLSPLALAFFPAWRRLSLPRALVIAGFALVALGCALHLHHNGEGRHWLAPFLIFPYVHPATVVNTFTMTTMPMKGPAPDPLPFGPRLIVSVLAVVASLTLFAGLLAKPTVPLAADEPPTASWIDLLWLAAPFSVLYLAFLLSRGIYNFAYDRYFLLVLPFLVVVLLRYMQLRERTRVPAFCGVLVALSALYSVVTFHDVFASYRAALAACQEIQNAGFPRTAIDGGWEYNHYTQILVGTYVHQVGVRMPDGSLLPNTDSDSATACSMDVREWTPDVHPEFAIAYPGSSCALVPQFAPVRYSTWMPPHRREIDVVHYSTLGPRKRQVPYE